MHNHYFILSMSIDYFIVDVHRNIAFSTSQYLLSTFFLKIYSHGSQLDFFSIGYAICNIYKHMRSPETADMPRPRNSGLTTVEANANR